MEPTTDGIERESLAAASPERPPETEDQMLGNSPRPYRAVFYPYGYELHFETNSDAVLRAASRYLGVWQPRFEGRPLELRFLVIPGERPAGGMAPPAFLHRIQRNLLSGIADRDNFYCCDLVAGFAFACASPEAIKNHELLRVPIDNMICALLWTSHVTAVHAACVMLRGKGVLLAGHSGAGKSSLAYACARRGWTFVSDDTSCLVKRAEGKTVIGNPYRFRFRESAGGLFPEFRGLKESCHGPGKPTIEVATSTLPGIEKAVDCQVDYIVFLNRREGRKGRVEFIPVPRERKLRQLYTGNWPSDLAARQEDWTTLQRLANVPAFELRYRELDVAAAALERLVRGESC